MSNQGISNSEDINEKFYIYLDVGSFFTIIILFFCAAFIWGYTSVRDGKGVEQSCKLYSAVLENNICNILCSVVTYMCFALWGVNLPKLNFSKNRNYWLIKYLCILSGVLKSNEKYYISNSK